MSDDFTELPSPRRELRFTTPPGGTLGPRGTLLAHAPVPEPGPTLVPASDNPDDPDGEGSVPARMAVVDGEVRFRVIVEAIKIPEAQRTTIRRILPDETAVADRAFLDGLGGDCPDDDPQFPAGSIDALDGARVFYSLMVTEDERAELDAHDNVIGARVAPLMQVL